MRIPKLGCAVLLGMAASLGTMLMAQVQTIVPPVVPGAKPVTVEHIKIHGAALEGNLEGDAVDRDVIRLPAAQLRERKASPLPRRLCVARLFDRSGTVDA